MAKKGKEEKQNKCFRDAFEWKFTVAAKRLSKQTGKKQFLGNFEGNDGYEQIVMYTTFSRVFEGNDGLEKVTQKSNVLTVPRCWT